MTHTSPWDESVPDALAAGPLEHTATARVVTAAGVTYPVTALAGTVEFDEAWSPHARADLTCVLVDDQATLDAIDPRAGARLVLEAGYVLPDGSVDSHQLATLCLRARPVERPDQTMGLTAVSDEIRVQDQTPLGGTRTYPIGSSVLDALVDLVTWLLPTATIVRTASSTATLDAAVTVSTGGNLWGAIIDLADRAGAWVRVDAAGTWQVSDRPQLGAASLMLATGQAGTLIRTSAELDVADWGNAVLATWPDGSQGWAWTTAAPLGVGVAPTKVVQVARTGPAPATAAARHAIAATMLPRAFSRGRSLTLTAPAAYWVRPGQSVTVTLPTGPEERHLVAAVRFDLATGLMTLTTRRPDDAMTIQTGA